MRIIGGITAHYGSDYIGYAVKSIYEFVDELWISFCTLPWGHRSTPIPNPDSIEKMREAAHIFGDPHNKIHFEQHDFWPDEGTHRDHITALATDRGADLLLRTDADEIWDQESLAGWLEIASRMEAHYYSLPFLHLWRSFDYYCDDDCRPLRIVNCKSWQVEHNFPPLIKEKVFHMGYARKPADVYYKALVHAHQEGDWKTWYQNVFLRFPTVTQNVHPTCVRPKPDGSNWWDIKPFDRYRLPNFMQSHPFWNMEIIQ
mgnify:CR=1 FL=1